MHKNGKSKSEHIAPAREDSTGNPARLDHAVKELHAEHPHGYNDRGPFHEDQSHVRHEPLGGLKPAHCK